MHPARHAAAHPDKPAVIVAETGATLTYGELDRASNQGAHLFRALGLRAGDTVALLMANGPAFLEVVWAAQRAGLYYVGLSTRLTAPEAAYILADSGAAVLVASPALMEVARAAAAGLALRLFAGEGAGSFADARAAHPATPIADEAPGQDMLYSSGTTGRPKGIRFAPRDGPVDAEMPVTRLARLLYGFGPDTVFLSPAPLYHTAPLRFLVACHQLGGTAVIMGRFDAAGALAAISRFGVTHAQWVPTHFVRLLALPDAVRAAHAHGSLRAVFHAAAPCPVPVKRAMIDGWGPIVHEYYSSTEMIGFTAVSCVEWLDRPGTMGRAMIGAIRVCDAAGEPVPVGETGEIFFENGTPLTYHNDPARTRAAHNRHGWSTVGDIGRVDGDGYLFLTDRKSFTIISGGVNIYPQEVEDALIARPKVADAAVVGAPDPDLGETVVAVVQPADGVGGDDALSAELMAYLRTRVAGPKLPRRIDYDPALPREPTGKLFKRLIRDRYRAAADPPPA